MAVSASILSWNIRLFGEIKISRLLRPDLFSAHERLPARARHSGLVPDAAGRLDI